MSAEIVTIVPSVIDSAGALMQKEYRPAFMWSASSGLPVSGEEAARNLEAVRDLLDRKGWRRTWDTDGGPEDPGEISDSASVPEMIRYLVRMLTAVIRYEYFSEPSGLELWQAMSRVDGDASSVSGRCMDLVLRARTGVRIRQLPLVVGARGPHDQ